MELNELCNEERQTDEKVEEDVSLALVAGEVVGSQEGLNLQQRVVVLPLPLLVALHLHRCN